MYKLLFILSISILASCGGGSGSVGANDSISASATYPIATTLANYVNNVSNAQVNITGTVSSAGQTFPISGTGGISERTTSSTFTGVSALMKTQSTAISMTMTANGQSQTQSIDGVDYLFYTSNYQPLGSSNSSSYCVTTNVSSLPAFATPGQSGEWYRMNCYTNISRAFLIGSKVVSYSLKAVSNTTANLVITQTLTDSTGQVIPTTDTYLITSAGAITYKESKANITSSGVTISLTMTAR